YTTAAGTTYDVGDYEPALTEALRRADYPGLRAAQQARRHRGDHLTLGIGICSYVEITSFSSKEFGSVEVGPDGAVTVLAGTSSHGQGHETAFAQIVSAVLGVPMERIAVIHSDTGVVPQGQGTWGSRSLQAGGSAVFERATEVLEKARTIAAHLLEVDVPDVTLAEGGRLGVAGAPERSLGWEELAAA